jgi:hypothetical protein
MGLRSKLIYTRIQFFKHVSRELDAAISASKLSYNQPLQESIKRFESKLCEMEKSYGEENECALSVQ